MPPPEARLLTLLRNVQFKPFHFRRQVAIGPYFADFASHGAKLVIEVDGDTHGSDAALKHAAARDRFIRDEGFDILRVTNRNVMNRLEGVAETILQCVGPSPTRPAPDRGGPPSPQGGGRRAVP